MSLPATTPRQYLTTLTNGWRFTLPTSVRKAHGWDAGTKLLATLRGASLLFSTERQSTDRQASTDGNLARDFDGETLEPVECYLGSGGKIVLPVPLRKRLGWIVGKRLVIVDEGDAVAVTLCCDAKRCESCGSISGVREIIQNVFLCSQCWGNYLREMHAKLRLGRARA
ncbi:MAG TPA: AbrB/MazE/SpoVT family DNA-binding domain-containing protein [Firmicutes bacterium]|nr:AbrB/MazE/SpoVT family DNA-binding domain-containing protein [Candidatus Fermentithermobacillaceae bacterium]